MIINFINESRMILFANDHRRYDKPFARSFTAVRISKLKSRIASFVDRTRRSWKLVVSLSRPRTADNARLQEEMKDQPKPELTPFERFWDLARRIVAVPKAEIDEQEAEYQRQREKRKASRPTP